MLPELYIGIMSGTSMDAVDAALVELDAQTQTFKTVALESLSIDATLRVNLVSLSTQPEINLQLLGETDIQLARLFAQTVNALLHKHQLSAGSIRAIGSHGQTVRHHPDAQSPFSMQIGNPSVIAELTQITTVADFRMADIAAGGQGAPLVPAFHQAVFGTSEKVRTIINIGGIANTSVLHPDQGTLQGYDIGPGNTLLDTWISQQRGRPYDANGDWARTGKVDNTLLQNMLSDDFIRRPPPKSTGREYFNAEWLEQHRAPFPTLKAVDIQTTLTEYTAQLIASSINSLHYDGYEKDAYLCGGGAKNTYLCERIQALTPECQIRTTNALGIDTQMVEAAAFAWLAAQTMNKRTGNCPRATGARKPKILGGIYLAS